MIDRTYLPFVSFQQDFRNYQADETLSFNHGDLTKLKFQQLGTEDAVIEQRNRYMDALARNGYRSGVRPKGKTILKSSEIFIMPRPDVNRVIATRILRNRIS